MFGFSNFFIEESTFKAIAKDCGILGDDVNLKNLGPKDYETDP